MAEIKFHKDPDPAKNKPFGLSYWMERVLTEADKASRDLDHDRVHDLRVALRRCRSMAQKFMALDPDKGWETLLKGGRRLFKRLGALRDVQILEEWIDRLGEPEDVVSMAMLFHLAQSERKLKHAAMDALHAFNRDRWRGLIGRLEARARHLPVGGVVFQLSALQAWNEAHTLQKHALRNRSDAAYHRLRIGIKGFRYTVENFLPLLHEAWGQDLRDMQDCLGEAHDLFVFWQTALRLNVFPDPASRERWRALIAKEKATRIEHYRAKMIGDHSLWSVWRLALPRQNQLPSATLKMIEKWAFFHGINLTRARQVQRLALLMFNDLQPGSRPEIKNERDILRLAAILQEFGRAKLGKSLGQEAAGLRLGLPSTLGFTPESLAIAAMIIRSQRGKFRSFDWEPYPGLSEEQRQLVMQLCGILRLARALSRDSAQKILSLKIEQTGHSIIILAAGYSELGPLAEKVARARYLLEYACQKPVIIRSASDNQDSASV
jgi:CHAD domain-containing protein